MAKLNPRKLIILGAGSLCSALIVIVMLNAALRPKEVEKPSGTEVLVVSRAMVAGDVLSDKNIRWESWPERQLYDGLVTRKAGEDTAATGKLKRALSAGEPVTKTAMVSDSDATLIAAQLEPGMRAVAIKVTAESSAGGFVTPADHVDVILSHRIKIDSGGAEAAMAAGLVERDASETILNNVKVLAVDQHSEKKDSISVGRTVTLAVTPKQAEMLALAAKMGDLSLSLRGLADQTAGNLEITEPDMTTDVEVSRVLGRLHAQNDSGGRVKNVRIYNSSGVDSHLYATHAQQGAGSTQVSAAR